MKIILIAAMTPHRLIGDHGKIPWHEPDDLRFFKRTTMGHAVIMGRKTFDSIDKPLTGRRNIVVTRDSALAARLQGASPPGDSTTTIDVVDSLETAIESCRRRGDEQVFIAGGGQIFETALPLADEMIITWIDRPDAVGDVFFPCWSEDDWEAVEETPVGKHRTVRLRRR